MNVVACITTIQLPKICFVRVRFVLLFPFTVLNTKTNFFQDTSVVELTPAQETQEEVCFVGEYRSAIVKFFQRTTSYLFMVFPTETHQSRINRGLSLESPVLVMAVEKRISLESTQNCQIMSIGLCQL